MSLISKAIGALLAITITALSGQALAQSPQQKTWSALERLFPNGEPACFARYYDAAHLKAHPKQSVTSVRLMRGYEEMRDDDGHTSDDGIHAQLIVTFRKDGGRRFIGGANCKSQEDGTILCYSDSCDGGLFPLRVVDDETILLGGDGGGHFTVSGGCGGGPDRSLNEGEDDKSFSLTRALIEQCR